MHSFTTTPDLLETARSLLRGTILPLVPDDKKRDVLMIANAMAITSREITQGRSAALHELTSLKKLMAAPAQHNDPTDDPSFVDAELTRLNKQLCDEIRIHASNSEAARIKEIRRHLLDSVRARLAISNPKYDRCP